MNSAAQIRLAGGAIAILSLAAIAAEPSRLFLYGVIGLCGAAGFILAPRFERDERIRFGVVSAAIVLSLALLARIGEASGALTNEWSARIAGAAIGVTLAITGNAVPKLVRPLSEQICNPARRQDAERFVGWIFVLGGALYALQWLAAPLDAAPLRSILIAFFGFAAAIGASLWARAGRTEPQRQFKGE
ncbi:MAG: hypothetical protein R3C60_05875 [Parvularculaceae bacterium]